MSGPHPGSGQRAGRVAADLSDHFGSAVLRRLAEVQDDLGGFAGIDVDESQSRVVFDGDDAIPGRSIVAVDDERPPQAVGSVR